MYLTDLIYKIEKLIFLNEVFITANVAMTNPTEALCALEDEIRQLETIYSEVKDQFERCF